MGFTLKKVVERQTPEGGWTKHIFYDTGDGQYFVIWDLRGIEGVVIEPEQWKGGIGNGLPYWINHIAFDCQNIGGLEDCNQRWLDHGYNVVEVKHEFIHAIYTRDPRRRAGRVHRRHPAADRGGRAGGRGAAGRRHSGPAARPRGRPASLAASSDPPRRREGGACRVGRRDLSRLRSCAVLP